MSETQSQAVQDFWSGFERFCMHGGLPVASYWRAVELQIAPWAQSAAPPELLMNWLRDQRPDKREFIEELGDAAATDAAMAAALDRVLRRRLAAWLASRGIPEDAAQKLAEQYTVGF